MKKNKFLVKLSILSAMLLTGCGGGGGGDASSDTSSASTSDSQISESTTSTSTSTSQADEHVVLDPELGDAPTYAEDSFMIHYWRTDGHYTDWNMWIWEQNHEGACYQFNGKDDWGVVAAYPLSLFDDLTTNQLGFIIRRSEEGQEWAEKDCGGGDLYVSISHLKKDLNGIYHVYMVSKQSTIYISSDLDVYATINLCCFVEQKDKLFMVTTTNLPITRYTIYRNGLVYKEVEDARNAKRVSVDFTNDFDYLDSYAIRVTLNNGVELDAVASKALILGSETFENTYYYDGDDLGANYDETTHHTLFKVWAPLTRSIKLRVYDTGTPEWLGGSDVYTEFDMNRSELGVFSFESEQDLRGKYYTYFVQNSEYPAGKEIVDPYAKSAGVNGSRGMIVDFSQTNPAGWEETNPLPYDRKELAVYETHVADVTSSKTWTGSEDNRKLFRGMYEENTTYEEGGVTVKTGFDHIKELGINAVQLIPIFDQANDEVNMTFNWGYNPLNYNVVEGGYSSNPYDGYVRIREFKELVQAYNKAGINIIMDVVYNHVSGALGSNMDVLMPGYYYRYDSSANLSNGSGCGNEVASEHRMVRKFIIDSVKFWAEEYKLGGFRFDLMGLHDLTTMEELTAAAKQINPHIAIYGEPWTGGTSPLPDAESAKQINGNKYVGYGAFNDMFRDGMIKGGLAGVQELGWITTNKATSSGDMSRILKGIKGITAASNEIADPDKTTNYVTCHDNYTLHDRAVMTGLYNDNDNLDQLVKMNVLANSVVMTSNGTSFMLAGEEMLRTKVIGYKEDGTPILSGNSYNASYETNELDYSLKVQHQDMFESYRQMIYLKRILKGLHLNKDQLDDIDPQANSTNTRISYDVAYSDTTNFKVIHVNGLGTDEKFDLSGYKLYWSTIEGEDKVLSVETALQPYETLVVYR